MPLLVFCFVFLKFPHAKVEMFPFLQPLSRELYNFDPELFLLPSFRKAISENTKESFRRIISEPFPGVLVFQMFQPDFFQKLIVEVTHHLATYLITFLFNSFAAV